MPDPYDLAVSGGGQDPNAREGPVAIAHVPGTEDRDDRLMKSRLDTPAGYTKVPGGR